MALSDLRTTIKLWTSFDDLTDAQIDEAIYLAQKKAERHLGILWPHMEVVDTSNTLTTSNDVITLPERFRSIKALIITESSGNTEIPLDPMPYRSMKNIYAQGSSWKDYPKFYALDTANSQIIVRPYPSSTFTTEFIYYQFSAKMTDEDDTNFWTDNAEDVLLFGAINILSLTEHDLEVKNPYKEEYMEALSMLADIYHNQEFEGGNYGLDSDWVM